MHPRPVPPGFSLPELLLVLAVLGILGAMAAPSLAGVLDAHRVRAALRLLATDLAYARMHAVRDGTSTELRLQWDSGGACVLAYQVREVGTTRPPLRAVLLRDLLPRGCLHSNNAEQPIRFGPRGLPTRVVARTVTARSGAAADTLVLSQLGRLLHRR